MLSAVYLVAAVIGVVGWLLTAYAEYRDEADAQAAPLVSSDCALLSRSAAAQERRVP